MKQHPLPDLARRVARRPSCQRLKQPAQLSVRVDLPGAKVKLLPGRYRDAGYVRRHVEFVLTRSSEQGEAHVQNNLRCIRENLLALGIDRGEVDIEVHRIECAVRAEIWRQVMLPGGAK